MNKQEELRNGCRFLKYEKKIRYEDIAKAIGMSTNAFYNFVSGSKVNLGYTKRKKLMSFIERTLNEKLQKQ